MVYLVSDFTHLNDVYAASPDASRERKLSSLNTSLWQQLTLMPVERLTYRGADGWEVDGFLVKPLGYQPRTAEIVFFPRENHNLTRTGEPKHLVESLHWQVYWFEKYVDGKKDLAPPNWR